MSFNPTKALVKDILSHPHRREWTLQGFGMLRTYMDDDVRLHVWDNRFRVPNVSMIHTHPWDFQSLVLVGAVRNYVYVECTGEAYDQGTSHFDCPLTKLRRQIKPGVGLKQTQEDVLIDLRIEQSYTVVDGMQYAQVADQIHASDPLNGTVTLVKRRRKGEDLAYVYIDPAIGFVSAEPTVATSDVVEMICSNALSAWFKP